MSLELFDTLEQRLDSLLVEYARMKEENDRLREENQRLLDDRQRMKWRVEQVLDRLNAAATP